MDPFSWSQAIKAALISLPKIVDLFQEMIARLDALKQAIDDKKIQEVKNAQTQLLREIQTVKSDEDRIRLAIRVSELERGIVRKP